tara:strand:+ start:101 stop:382 length:282 start_codon:yes stop_codon:yes gene_type:complete
MKQKFTLVSFQITDNETTYLEHSIFKKDTTNMNEEDTLDVLNDFPKSEIIYKVYGEDFECSYRTVLVDSTQEITKAEVDTLEKLHIPVEIINY